MRVVVRMLQTITTTTTRYILTTTTTTTTTIDHVPFVSWNFPVTKSSRRVTKDVTMSFTRSVCTNGWNDPIRVPVVAVICGRHHIHRLIGCMLCRRLWDLLCDLRFRAVLHPKEYSRSFDPCTESRLHPTTTYEAHTTHKQSTANQNV
jgi:hypothetical protein